MNNTETLDSVLLRQIEESEADAGSTQVMTRLEAGILLAITFGLFPLLGYLSY